MKNLFSLEKQRVLITGAAGGIGSAVAKVSASLGAETILVDRYPQNLSCRSRGFIAKFAAHAVEL
jgi:NAD(P)-dependent dehydrogenase (short-subunit alcohol dehydrogenase family)